MPDEKKWIAQPHLDPKVKEQLRETFAQHAPFPHLVLDNFLVSDQLDAVADALCKEEFTFKEADLFSFSQTTDLKSSENTDIKQFHEFLSTTFVDFMSELTGLSLQRGKLDLHGTLYEDTDYLLCHDDQLEGRKIAFLLYLSDFEEEDGGYLGLMDGKFEAKVKIMPKINRLAFFEVSDKSFHFVEEVVADKQRLAFGGWLYD